MLEADGSYPVDSSVSPPSPHRRPSTKDLDGAVCVATLKGHESPVSQTRPFKGLYLANERLLGVNKIMNLRRSLRFVQFYTCFDKGFLVRVYSFI